MSKGAFGMQTEEVEPIEGLRSALDHAIKKVLDGEATVAGAIAGDERSTDLLESWWKPPAR